MPAASLEQRVAAGSPLVASGTQSRLPDASVAIGRRRPGAAWAYACIAIQFLCQLALLLPALAPGRVFFRSLALGTSFAFLLLIPGSSRRFRGVERWGVGIIVVVSLSALNPDGGAPLAVAASWGLYLAVLAPLYWVGRLELSRRTLGTLLIVFWAFHFASSVVGVLQVYFPGQFQPALTTFIDERYVASIRLASGEWVARPMGLSDTPGGAGPSGFYATLFGFGIVLLKPFPFARVVGLGSMVTGMVCIYLSHVRTALVLLGVCVSVLVTLLMLSRRISRVLGALMLGLAVVVVGFEIALRLGGDMMLARMSSLISSAPMTVYHANRGSLLENLLFEVLPQYPLGAGLAHWGMMNAYFGGREHEIGAELQWTGWTLDGGIVLVGVYAGAMLAALFAVIRESITALDEERRCWVAIVAAYDVGVLALCFSYAPFAGTAGIQFWLLNAVVFGTSATATRAARLVTRAAVR
jgi:hypothetical protein